VLNEYTTADASTAGVGGRLAALSICCCGTERFADRRTQLPLNRTPVRACVLILRIPARGSSATAVVHSVGVGATRWVEKRDDHFRQLGSTVFEYQA
jgi:hypothetical protein